MTSFKKSANLKVSIAFVDENAAAVDITGATVKFMMKNNESDSDAAAVVSKQTGSGISITSPTGGLAEATLTAADLNTITEQGIYCEAMAINGSEVIRTDTYFFTVKQNLIKAIS